MCQGAPAWLDLQRCWKVRSWGVRVLCEEAAMGLSSCSWAIPSSSKPRSLWASCLHRLTMVSMSQTMSGMAMDPTLGSMHWSMASLSSPSWHKQHRKRLSIDQTCHQLIPGMEESFWCREGSTRLRMLCCSLNSTSHSCGKRPPSLSLSSGTAPLCSGCSSRGDGATVSAGTVLVLSWKLAGTGIAGRETTHSMYCLSPHTETLMVFIAVLQSGQLALSLAHVMLCRWALRTAASSHRHNPAQYKVSLNLQVYSNAQHNPGTSRTESGSANASTQAVTAAHTHNPLPAGVTAWWYHLGHHVHPLTQHCQVYH